MTCSMVPSFTISQCFSTPSDNFKSTSELLLLFLLDAKKVPKKEKLSSIALILCSKIFNAKNQKNSEITFSYQEILGFRIFE